MGSGLKLIIPYLYLVVIVAYTLIATVVASRPAPLPPPRVSTSDGNSDTDKNTETRSWGGAELQQQWSQCGCAAVEMACEELHTHQGLAAVVACASLAPECGSGSRGGDAPRGPDRLI
jgi:hypothetical protein